MNITRRNDLIRRIKQKKRKNRKKGKTEKYILYSNNDYIVIDTIIF